MENTPKTLLKVYVASQIFMVLFVLELGILQIQQQKNSIDAVYLLLRMQLKFYMAKKWELFIWYYFNAWTLTGLLAVRNIFAFPKDQ